MSIHILPDLPAPTTEQPEKHSTEKYSMSWKAAIGILAITIPVISITAILLVSKWRRYQRRRSQQQTTLPHYAYVTAPNGQVGNQLVLSNGQTTAPPMYESSMADPPPAYSEALMLPKPIYDQMQPPLYTEIQTCQDLHPHHYIHI